jgi:COPII coat assembly protein SEC16
VRSSYCEAITSSLAKPSPYFNEVFVEQLRSLADRISGIPHADKSSWMGGKIGKPSLDSIGGWLEGRFTKLVTGDESPGPQQIELQKNDFFPQFSAISSATTSTTTSPQVYPANSIANTNGPKRSESMVSLVNLPPPSERSASAMDYTRRRHSPVSRIASANAATTTFAQSFGQAMTPMNNAAYESGTPRVSTDTADGETGQEVTWWGSSNNYGDNNFQTPTATNFVKLSEGPELAPSSDGLISLMDNSPFSVTPVSSTSHTPQHHIEDEDEEDLGFGNSKPKHKAQPEDENVDTSKSTSPAAAAPTRPGQSTDNSSLLVVDQVFNRSQASATKCQWIVA